MISDWDNSPYIPPILEESSTLPPTIELPIFNLLKQDFNSSHENGKITKISINNFIMIIGTEFNNIIRWNMRTEEYTSMVVSRKVEDKINNIFIDKVGINIIITCTNGTVYYLNFISTKSKVSPLNKLKGVNVVSIAWDACNEESTSRHFLVGCENGDILDYYMDGDKEIKVKKLYSVKEDNTDVPICGITFTTFPLSDKILVLVCTPTRQYSFIGNGTVENVFSVYISPNNMLPKFIELPGVLKHSILDTFSIHERLQTCAWLTGAGVFYGQFLFGQQSPGEDAFGATKLLPTSQPPSSLLLTEFHLLLLFKGRIVVVNTLSEQIVQEIPVRDVIGILRDTTNNCIFLYSEDAIYELSINNEDRNIWKLYLEQGNFDAALEHANLSEQDIIKQAEAYSFFMKGHFEHAAKLYADTTRSFEELVLKFMNYKADDALRTYLTCKLEMYGSKQPSSQNVMLCTWLAEIHLDKLNSFKDKSGDAFDACLLDFYHFLKSYHPILKINKTSIIELITSHGRVDEFLYFCSIIGEHEKIIAHHIHAGNYKAAIEVLEFLEPPENYVALFYKYASTLMKFAPVESISLFLSCDFLDPCKLYPFIVRESQSLLELAQACRYLEHWNETKNTLVNYLASLYAQSTDENVLLELISKYKRQLDYKQLLRLCHSNNKIRSCVMLYSYMGLFEEAVKLALSDLCARGGDISLAKQVAKMTRDDDLEVNVEEMIDEKKLWHVIEKTGNVKQAIEMMKEYRDSDDNVILKIDDILPFFPDSARIADFKNEICSSLDDYNAHIASLKKEMDESTQSANQIRKEITQLRHRCGYVNAGQKCDICLKLALSNQFLVFPCSHVFHLDCIVRELKNISSLSTSELELRAIDECLYCGNHLISLITKPFINDDENEWEL